jgi:hypothetical protein
MGMRLLVRRMVWGIVTAFLALFVGVTAAPAPVSAAAATQFFVATPISATAGSSFTFTVTAQDGGGVTDAGYGGTVHFTSSDTGAGVSIPTDYTFLPADAGVHTFSGTFVTAGNQTITATDTVDGTITGTSNPTSVTAAPATHFTSSAPGTATAGTPINVTVAALDPFNNTDTGYGGTIHFTSSDAAAVLPGDTTLTAGTGTFPATLNTAGNQTITATDTVTSSITGTSGTITVAAGAATHFSVSAPGSATAGTPISVTITALDAAGNTDTTYSGMVHFTSSDGIAALPTDATLTAGVDTFPATLNTAGNQTVTAADTVIPSITGTSNTITVSAGAATHFTVSAPGTATAGAGISVTVTALDASGNTATGYTGTVHFTSSDAAAVLPANGTLTAGVSTFPATLNTAGNQTITATDTVTSSITGTSNTVTVAAGAATHFTVSAPGTATAGTPISVTVTALDAANNTATGYAGTVHCTSSDGAAVLPGNSILTAGVDTFPATLNTAGNQTITATDTVTSSITGASGTITVAAGAATHFAVSAPGTATAGNAFNFTVTALDAANNTATAYAGTAHFTSSDGAATLPANATLTAGVGTFSATLRTAGNQTVTATDTVTSSITGDSSIIVVSASGATHFTVAAPATATAGAGFSITVTALDASNNTATGYTGTVHFTSTDSQAILPANATLTAGTGIFSATLKTAGNQTVTATDTTTASITGASSIIVVSAGAATHFSIAGTPGPAGTPTTFTITALDASGNVATGYTGTIHFTSSDTNAALPPDAAFTAGGQGVKTVTVTFNTAGTQSLTVADTTNPAIGGSAPAIPVAPATLTKVTVTASSVTIEVGQQVQLTATATFSNSTTQDVTGAVTWGTADANIATVSSTGKVTGKAGGTVVITATMSGQHGQASVTVKSPTLVGVQPAPAPAGRPGPTGPPAGGIPPAPKPPSR